MKYICIYNIYIHIYTSDMDVYIDIDIDNCGTTATDNLKY